MPYQNYVLRSTTNTIEQTNHIYYQRSFPLPFIHTNIASFANCDALYMIFDSFRRAGGFAAAAAAAAAVAAAGATVGAAPRQLWDEKSCWLKSKKPKSLLVECWDESTKLRAVAGMPPAGDASCGRASFFLLPRVGLFLPLL